MSNEKRTVGIPATDSELLTLPDSGDVSGWAELANQIRSKLSHRRQRVGALASERKSLALASMTGDTAAVKRTRVIEAETERLTAEIENLEAALVEAGKGAERAREIQQNIKDKARAAALVELAKKREAATRRLDESLSSMALALRDWLGTYETLASEGVPVHADRAAFRVRAAINAAVQAADLDSADRRRSLGVATLGEGKVFIREMNAHRRPLLPDHEVQNILAIAATLTGDNGVETEREAA